MDGHHSMHPPAVIHLRNLAGILVWPREVLVVVRQERTALLEAGTVRGEVTHCHGRRGGAAGVVGR